MNKSLESIAILVITAATIGIYFIFIASSPNHQTFAQGKLTIKEALEKTFDKKSEKTGNDLIYSYYYYCIYQGKSENEVLVHSVNTHPCKPALPDKTITSL